MISKLNELAPRPVFHAFIVDQYTVTIQQCSTFYRDLYSTVEMAGSSFHTAYDTALSLTIWNGVQNHLAPKTLHYYFTIFKLLYASSIHTRSSSPHVTDHVSQLAQEDFVSEQKSQALMHVTYSIIARRMRSEAVQRSTGTLA